eukprot:SAG31_NODE_16142_length_721_cov_1.226688_1_plen_31_part_01
MRMWLEVQLLPAQQGQGWWNLSINSLTGADQ